MDTRKLTKEQRYERWRKTHPFTLAEEKLNMIWRRKEICRNEKTRKLLEKIEGKKVLANKRDSLNQIRAEAMYDLRIKGLTYEEIGKEFGVSRERVRQIGKILPPEKAQFFRNFSVIKKTFIIREKRKCPKCGKLFEVRNTSSRKYCSWECFKTFYRVHRHIPEEVRSNPNEYRKWLYHNYPKRKDSQIKATKNWRMRKMKDPVWVKKLRARQKINSANWLARKMVKNGIKK